MISGVILQANVGYPPVTKHAIGHLTFKEDKPLHEWTDRGACFDIYDAVSTV